MSIYDFSLKIDAKNRITQVKWSDKKQQESFQALEETLLLEDYHDFFDVEAWQDRGTISWKNQDFEYEKIISLPAETLLIFKKKSPHHLLYKRALDSILEGIQIYDREARVVYINQASRKLSAIPENISVTGKHLQELYQVQEDVSTVMTCLKTESPVINRFDSFQSRDGKPIVSVNTAFPVHQNKKLIGAVVFEQSPSIVQAQLENLQGIEKALEIKTASPNPVIAYNGYSFQDLIGRDETFMNAIQLAKKVASQNSHVLLVGETGTGKEIFAQSIHKQSPRSSKAFVAINCAAIPEALVEGLFFGTVKGTFTGSLDKTGYLEEASGGTLFLDELNAMSLPMQAKILRVIQEGVFRPVGGSKDITTDLRIVSSCNEDPFQLIRDNQLRKDLFYRLSSILIEIPPLRQRKTDIKPLIEHYLESRSADYAKAFHSVSPETLQILESYQWPGNVRELFHVLNHMLNVMDDAVAMPRHLPQYMQQDLPVASLSLNIPGELLDSDLQSIMDLHESQVLQQFLAYYGNNITQTAQALGIKRQSLQYRIRKYGIQT